MTHEPPSQAPEGEPMTTLTTTTVLDENLKKSREVEEAIHVHGYGYRWFRLGS